MGLFSLDIGIDLGTANTLVYVRGKGIVINEPSWVAVEKRTRQPVAIGAQAKEMVGRTPANLNVIRPMRDGVISEFEITQSMLSYFIGRAHQQTIAPFPRPDRRRYSLRSDRRGAARGIRRGDGRRRARDLFNRRTGRNGDRDQAPD